MNLKDTYNQIAEDWYADHKNDDWWIEGTEHFCSLFKSGDNILDIGCGAGIKSKYISEKGLVVTGIDFSEKFIDIANRENPKIRFCVLDMKDVSGLKTKFEGVFAQASLLHIPKKEILDVIERLVETLKQGGYLYVAVKGKRVGGLDEEMVEEKDYGYSYNRFFSFYTIDELEGYFNKLKLDIVYKNSKMYGKTNWLQIIEKKL